MTRIIPAENLQSTTFYKSGVMLAVVRAQFIHDVFGGFAGGFKLTGRERNGSNTCVSAAAVTLADLSEIFHVLRVRPRIGSD
jgi:hypothetical protein